MTRRIVIGILWGVVIYFAACALTGAIIGFVIGAQSTNEANMNAEISRTIAKAIHFLRPYYLLGALLIAGAGIWKGFLPWMGIKKPEV
jgi:flagellar biosynthesis protein FliR